jgi:2-polyprenyl-3-methyl-5-hydroxy-6-metoxy-1,4-benzoquinol methylase
MKKQISDLLLRLFFFLHSYSYKAINKIAVIKHGGIHPKHDIMRYHDFFLDNIASTDSVLDIGCGNGALTYDLAEKAKKVIGIDISKKQIAAAKENYKKDNLAFVSGDVVNYNFREKFDAIVMSNVLEHIDERSEFLKRLRNISPKLLIRVPLVTRSWLAFYLKKQGYDYRLDKTHFTEYTLEQINDELDKSSWKIKDYHINFGEFYGIIIPSQ